MVVDYTIDKRDGTTWAIGLCIADGKEIHFEMPFTVEAEIEPTLLFILHFHKSE